MHVAGSRPEDVGRLRPRWIGLVRLADAPAGEVEALREQHRLPRAMASCRWPRSWGGCARSAPTPPRWLPARCPAGHGDAAGWVARLRERAAAGARRAGAGGATLSMGWDLLVCDLDGTLVDKKTGLDPTLVEGFHRARERGLRIALATGRMPPGAERFRDELGVTDPCIFYNGALIRDHESGRDLFSLTLPRGLLGQIYGEIRQCADPPALLSG